MCPRHLAPDHPYLRTADLPLAPVDICDALAKVEGGVLSVVDTLDLDERCAGIGVPLACIRGATLVRRRMKELLVICRTNRAGTRCAFPCGRIC